MNETVANLISQDRYIQHYVYESLRQQFPQLNDTTKLERVNDRRVFLYPELRMRYSDMVEVGYSPILGWRILKNYLFPDNQIIELLDDPVYRGQWVQKLWKSLFLSPTYVFWRVMGRVFLRPDWEHKGQHRDQWPKMSAPLPEPEVIELKPFAWRLYGAFNEEDGRLWCAYHGGRDTFFYYQ